MKKCLKCSKEFKIHIVIDGKERNINKRKYCLECSPFGKRNTKRLHLPQRDKNSTKHCTLCGRVFHWTKNNVCSTCRTFKRRNDQRIRAIEYLGAKCDNCHHEDTDVLTFHHTNPKNKKFNLCQSWQKPWKTILSEIKKCKLLCANCHMKLHKKEIK
jgi:hypothetical protein